MEPLIENIHFYLNEEGLMVFTEKYLRDRGYCCGNGCKHCPYEFINVPEPKRSELIKKRQKNAAK
jgi:hypothetical protein